MQRRNIRSELRQIEENTGFTFLVIISSLSFMITFTGMLLSLVIYIDVRRHGDACQCIEETSSLLLQKLTEIIQEECGDG